MAIDAALVGSFSGAQTTPFTTAGGSVTSGDTLVFMACYNPGISAPTVSLSTSEALTLIGTIQSNDQDLGIWVKENSTGGASVTGTANYAGTSVYGTVYLVKVTGATTTPTDVNAQGADTATPYSSVSTGTLSQADEVIITICAINDGGGTTRTYSSSNTTILAQESDWTNYYTSCISKVVVASTTSFAPSFTCTEGTRAGIKLVTFKAAGGGGGGSSIAAISNYYRMMRGA